MATSISLGRCQRKMSSPPQDGGGSVSSSPENSVINIPTDKWPPSRTISVLKHDLESSARTEQQGAVLGVEMKPLRTTYP